MKKRLLVIGGIIAAACVVGGAGWYVWNQGMMSGNESRVFVMTVEALTGDVAGTQNRYAGVVEPQQTVNVKLESGLQVKEVKVKEGDAVTAGTVLFEYDASASQDSLAQAQLDLDRLKNEAQSLQDQIKTLTNEKKNASQDDQLSYTIEIQSAEMDLKKNEYDQKSKQAEIDKLSNQSGSLQVTSGIDGIIKEINDNAISDSGSDFSGMSDNTGGGEESNFITIVATGNYRVKGVVNETNMASIMPGSPVIVRSRIDANITWTGVLSGVSTEEPEKTDNDMYSYDSGSEQTTSSNYPFYVELDSSDGLMMGQHVYIELDYGQEEAKEGIWLEEFYIMDAGEEPYVWAADSHDRLEKRSVTLGEYDEELMQFQILDGLTKNDLIAFPDETYAEGMKTTTEELVPEDGKGGDGEVLP